MASREKRVPEAVLHHRRRLRWEGGPGDPGSALRTQSCAPAASPPPKPFLGWARTHALRSRADAGGEHPVAEAAARTAAGSGSGARRSPRAAEADTRTRTQPRGPALLRTHRNRQAAAAPATPARRCAAPRPLGALAAAARPLRCWRLTVKSRSDRSHRETAAGSDCGTGRRRRRRRQGSRRCHCACAWAPAAPADPGRGAGAGR